MIFPALSRQGLELAGACPGQTSDILAAKASTVRLVMTMSPDCDDVELDRIAKLIVPNIVLPYRR